MVSLISILPFLALAYASITVDKRSHDQLKIKLSGSDQCIGRTAEQTVAEQLQLVPCAEGTTWDISRDGLGKIALASNSNRVLDAVDGNKDDMIVSLWTYDAERAGQKWDLNDDGRISIQSKDNTNAGTRYCLSTIDDDSDPIRIRPCVSGPDAAAPDTSIKQVWDLLALSQ